MDIKLTCPLGAECETIKDNQVCRCRWYVALRGKNPMSEEMIDDWQCALFWLPVLLVENAQTNRGQTQALESFRNEMVKGQAVFNGLVVGSIGERKLSNGE
jgi:hypothetical protein